MHPTDTLLSLSHARIARAAVAGPRRATSPRALTDRQHMARIAQADPWTARHSVGAAIVRMRAINEMHDSLARRLDALPGV